MLKRNDVALSAQVLQEFYTTATGKKGLQINRQEAISIIEHLETFPVLPISKELVRAAIELHIRYQISYWDGAILAAAKAMSCTTVYSEDLNSGQSYDGVKVINPFLATSP